MFTSAVPSAAPDDVVVEVINSSVVKVSWMRVHKDKLHGHLGGYRVIFEKQTFALRCSLKGQSMTFSTDSPAQYRRQKNNNVEFFHHICPFLTFSETFRDA